MNWLDILKLAVMITAILAPILLGVARLWVASVGDQRWAPKKLEADVEATTNLVLAQQDASSAHNDRIIRLEEADKNIMGPLRDTLEKINANMGDMGTRLARLESIPERLTSIEKRLDRRVDER